MQNNKYTLCSFLSMHRRADCVLRISWKFFKRSKPFVLPAKIYYPSKIFDVASCISLPVYPSVHTAMLCLWVFLQCSPGFIALNGKFHNNVWKIRVGECECGFHNLYLLNYMEDTLLFLWDSQFAMSSNQVSNEVERNWTTYIGTIENNIFRW